jgi:hypothetical protein
MVEKLPPLLQFRLLCQRRRHTLCQTNTSSGRTWSNDRFGKEAAEQDGPDAAQWWSIAPHWSPSPKTRYITYVFLHTKLLTHLTPSTTVSLMDDARSDTNKRTMVFIGTARLSHSPTPRPARRNQIFPGNMQFLPRSTPSKKP